MWNVTPNSVAKTVSALKPLPLRPLAALVTVLAFTLAVSLLSQERVCRAPFREDTLVLTPSGQAIGVEIADDQAEQTKGLGGRACLSKNAGMLFSFDRPGNYSFWMKGMRFNIDIVWLDTDRRVVGVKRNLSPASYPKTYDSPKPAQYVLELPAGQAAELGLKEGASVTF